MTISELFLVIICNFSAVQLEWQRIKDRAKLYTL